MAFPGQLRAEYAAASRKNMLAWIYFVTRSKRCEDRCREHCTPETHTLASATSVPAEASSKGCSLDDPQNASDLLSGFAGCGQIGICRAQRRPICRTATRKETTEGRSGFDGRGSTPVSCSGQRRSPGSPLCAGADDGDAPGRVARFTMERPGSGSGETPGAAHAHPRSSRQSHACGTEIPDLTPVYPTHPSGGHGSAKPCPETENLSSEGRFLRRRAGMGLL